LLQSKLLQRLPLPSGQKMCHACTSIFLLALALALASYALIVMTCSILIILREIDLCCTLDVRQLQYFETVYNILLCCAIVLMKSAVPVNDLVKICQRNAKFVLFALFIILTTKIENINMRMH
jgi:hypothetical protein